MSRLILKSFLFNLLALCAINLAYADSFQAVGAGLTSIALVDVAPTSQGFVAVGGNALLYGSGANWNVATSPVDTAIYQAVAFHGNTGLAVSVWGSVALSQNDGAQWKSLDLPAFHGSNLYDVVSDSLGDFWIGGGHGRVYHVTSDLANATIDTLDTARTLKKVMATPHGMWALDYDGHRYVRRANGTWADSGNVLGADSGYYTSIGPAAYVAQGLTFAEYLPSGYWAGVSRTGCGIVCNTTLSKVRYSVDGETWKDTLVDSGSTKIAFHGIASSGDSLVILAGDHGAVRESRGNGWDSSSTGVTTNLQSITYGNGAFVIVGATGTLLHLALGNATSHEAVVPWQPLWQVQMGDQHLNVHMVATVPAGNMQVEFVDMQGHVFSALATVGAGWIKVAPPKGLARSSYILRSRDARYPFAPVLIDW